MNIQEYIRSGIIEAYVLGLADDEDARSIEAMRAQHPEVEDAIRSFEESLEQKFKQQSVPVDSNLKKELFHTLGIRQDFGVAGKTTVFKQPTRQLWKYIAAAAIALLVLSTGLNLYTFNKYRKLEAANKELAMERIQLFAKNDALDARVQYLDSGLKIMNRPGVIKIALQPVPGKEGNDAIVYWSKATSEVYISIQHLPSAPAGRQYQLWALQDGKPVDAGVLGSCPSICKQKNIGRAQAFAITLEKEGGSAAPSLDQLFLMGKI